MKHRSIEGEIRERIVKGRQVMGALDSHERKKCKNGGKKWHKKQCYPSDPVICLRDMNMECSTAIMNRAVEMSCT